jgi:hypothetical protein
LNLISRLFQAKTNVEKGGKRPVDHQTTAASSSSSRERPRTVSYERQTGVIKAFDHRLMDVAGSSRAFSGVSDNIADNLMNHVEGRLHGKRKTRKIGSGLTVLQAGISGNFRSSGRDFRRNANNVPRLEPGRLVLDFLHS